MVIRVWEASEQCYWSSLKFLPIQFACPGQSDRSLYQKRNIKLLQATNYSAKLSLSMSVCLWNHCDQSDLTSLGFVSPEQKDRAALQIIKTNWTKLTWPVTSSSLDVLGKKTDRQLWPDGRSDFLQFTMQFKQPVLYFAFLYFVDCSAKHCRFLQNWRSAPWRRVINHHSYDVRPCIICMKLMQIGWKKREK